DQTYEYATHYIYDIHGNVKTLLQDYAKLEASFPSLSAERYKQVSYKYDLVSGNVHRVSVETGKAGQWHHAYEYDADNRITGAYTNRYTPVLPNSQGSPALQAELIYNQDWEQEA